MTAACSSPVGYSSTPGGGAPEASSEDEDGAHIELDDATELVAHVHEMSKASLVLTDELIEAARASGNLPPQPDEDDLGGLEIDESDEDTETDEETGDVK